MALITILKDYLSALHDAQMSYYVPTPRIEILEHIKIITILRETPGYLFLSIKQSFFDLITFQWLSNLAYFPSFIPKIQSSVLNETLIVEKPFSTILTFPYKPTLTLGGEENKLLAGFLNSFFLSLPISTSHILTLRRYLIFGVGPGAMAALGTILGQLFFAISVLFGFRSILIAWFSFPVLSALIQIVVFLFVIIEGIVEPTYRKKDTNSKKSVVKYFLLNLFLSWAEQGYVFRYFGNLTFTPEPNALDLLVSNTEISPFILTAYYVLGLFFGTLFFTALFGYLIHRLKVFVVDRYYSNILGYWYRPLDLLLRRLMVLFVFFASPLAFYNLDYYFYGALGFVYDDPVIFQTAFRTSDVEPPLFNGISVGLHNCGYALLLTDFDKHNTQNHKGNGLTFDLLTMPLEEMAVFKQRKNYNQNAKGTRGGRFLKPVLRYARNNIDVFKDIRETKLLQERRFYNQRRNHQTGLGSSTLCYFNVENKLRYPSKKEKKATLLKGYEESPVSFFQNFSTREGVRDRKVMLFLNDNDYERGAPDWIFQPSQPPASGKKKRTIRTRFDYGEKYSERGEKIYLFARHPLSFQSRYGRPSVFKGIIYDENAHLDKHPRDTYSRRLREYEEAEREHYAALKNGNNKSNVIYMSALNMFLNVPPFSSLSGYLDEEFERGMGRVKEAYPEIKEETRQTLEKIGKKRREKARVAKDRWDAKRSRFSFLGAPLRAVKRPISGSMRAVEGWVVKTIKRTTGFSFGGEKKSAVTARKLLNERVRAVVNEEVREGEEISFNLKSPNPVRKEPGILSKRVFGDPGKREREDTRLKLTRLLEQYEQLFQFKSREKETKKLTPASSSVANAFSDDYKYMMALETQISAIPLSHKQSGIHKKTDRGPVTESATPLSQKQSSIHKETDPSPVTNKFWAKVMEKDARRAREFMTEPSRVPVQRLKKLKFNDKKTDSEEIQPVKLKPAKRFFDHNSFSLSQPTHPRKSTQTHNSPSDRVGYKRGIYFTLRREIRPFPFFERALNGYMAVRGTLRSERGLVKKKPHEYLDYYKRRKTKAGRARLRILRHYTLLYNLCFDLSSQNQPASQHLTTEEEIRLDEKRTVLAVYDDSSLYFNKMEAGPIDFIFDPALKLGGVATTHQYMGSHNYVRHTFAITEDVGAGEDSQRERRQNHPILKFDQALYLTKSSTSYKKPFHEELFKKPFDSELLQKREREERNPFLEISHSTPFYVGWDEELREIVVTNRLLPRSLAGYGLYSPKTRGDRSGDEVNHSNKSYEKNKREQKEIIAKQGEREESRKSYSSEKRFASFISLKEDITFKTWPLPLRVLDRKRNHDKYIPGVFLAEERWVSREKTGWDHLNIKQEAGEPLIAITANRVVRVEDFFLKAKLEEAPLREKVDVSKRLSINLYKTEPFNYIPSNFLLYKRKNRFSFNYQRQRLYNNLRFPTFRAKLRKFLDKEPTTNTKGTYFWPGSPHSYITVHTQEWELETEESVDYILYRGNESVESSADSSGEEWYSSHDSSEDE